MSKHLQSSKTSNLNLSMTTSPYLLIMQVSEAEVRKVNLKKGGIFYVSSTGVV